MGKSDDLIWYSIEASEKFSYYIIGLNVAGIGFTVHQTMGIPLSESHIILGLSTLSWVLSIYFGLNYIKWSIRMARMNAFYIDSEKSVDHTRTDESEIFYRKRREEFYQVLKTKSSDMGKRFSKMNIFFYIGILLFVGWRIFEMYQLSVQSKIQLIEIIRAWLS